MTYIGRAQAPLVAFFIDAEDPDAAPLLEGAWVGELPVVGVLLDLTIDGVVTTWVVATHRWGIRAAERGTETIAERRVVIGLERL